ncbi:MAG: hypothetical protein R2855_06005 [Thermomicrobiales bacterium]
MQQPDWDPRDVTVLRDQRAAYDAMRANCPVAYSEFLGWSLFRHEDIAEVLAHPEIYRSGSPHRAIPNGMDPPDHTRYRSALVPFFDTDQMSAFEPRCRAIAAQLAELAVGLDKMEFVGEFAEPYALGAQCAFLGWPEVVWVHLQGWTHGNQEAALSRDRAASKSLAEELERYVEVAGTSPPTVTHTVERPTVRLMATEVDGQPLSDSDLASILRNWIAGHGTVAAGLGILIFHLVTDQQRHNNDSERPASIAAAVDEILRVDDWLGKSAYHQRGRRNRWPTDSGRLQGDAQGWRQTATSKVSRC